MALDKTVRELHQIVKAYKKSSQLIERDIHISTLRRYLGLLEFNLTLEKFRGITVEQAQLRWKERYDQKIRARDIILGNYNIGIIHAVIKLSDNLTNAAGRLGLLANPFEKYLNTNLGTTYIDFKDMTEEEAQAKWSDYKSFEIKDDAFEIPPGGYKNIPEKPVSWRSRTMPPQSSTAINSVQPPQITTTPSNLQNLSFSAQIPSTGPYYHFMATPLQQVESMHPVFPPQYLPLQSSSQQPNLISQPQGYSQPPLPKSARPTGPSVSNATGARKRTIYHISESPEPGDESQNNHSQTQRFPEETVSKIPESLLHKKPTLSDDLKLTLQSFRLKIPFRLQFMPDEKGKLVITPENPKQVDQLHAELSSNGITATKCYYALDLDTEEAITQFFNKYFKTEQNLIDKLTLLENKTLRETIFQKLLLIALGISIYEYNKKRLNFNYEVVGLHCPWIDKDNKIVLEIIDIDNKKSLITGFDELEAYINCNSLEVPALLLNLIKHNCYKTTNVFEIIEDCASKEPKSKLQSMNKNEREYYKSFICPLSERLIRFPVRLGSIIYDESFLLSSMYNAGGFYTNQPKGYSIDTFATKMLDTFIKNFTDHRNLQLIGNYRVAQLKPNNQTQLKFNQKTLSGDDHLMAVSTTPNTTTSTHQRNSRFWHKNGDKAQQSGQTQQQSTQAGKFSISSITNN